LLPNETAGNCRAKAGVWLRIFEALAARSLHSLKLAGRCLAARHLAAARL
jgi:hypothetical protein